MSKNRRVTIDWLGSRTLLYTLLLLAPLALLSGCGSGQTGSGQANSVPVNLAVTFPQQSTSTASASTIGDRVWAVVQRWLPTPSSAWAVGTVNDLASLTVEVSAPDLTLPITKTVSLSTPTSGQVITLTLDIPVGSNRVFTVSTLDVNKVTIFQGKSAPITLTAEQPATVNIQLIGLPSVGPTFEFIGSPGRELLAVNPASPGTPTPVKVNNTVVILGNPPSAGNNTLDEFSSATLILTASYNSTTKTYTNLQRNTILFTSGGKFYKASTLVGDGVPGSAPGNEPQQISNVSDAVSCSVGSAFDVVNSNQAVRFVSAGTDGTCFTGDDRPVVMHLNDSAQTPPVLLPEGTSSDEETVYDATTGLALHQLFTNSNGDLLSLDNSFTLTPIVNGAGIGHVNVVAQQPDKVFVGTFTNLYIYTPSTHTLNSTPVVRADPETRFIDVNDVTQGTDLSNIFLIQTDGAVYKVPLSTTAPVTTKHFVAPANTVAYKARMTTNTIAIATGFSPSGTFGSFNFCYTSNPRTCNNGIIAVDKVTGLATTIEAAASEKAIFLNESFNNYVLYTKIDDSAAGGGISNGALLRIEDASALAVLIGPSGSWGGQVVANSASWVTLHAPTVRAVFSQFTDVGPPATGTVSAISSPTGSPVLLGAVSVSPAVTNMPFFFESFETTMIGKALLQASPTNHQPYFLDAALANSLAPITTPGAAAKWEKIRD